MQPTDTAPLSLSPSLCEQARLSRDPRFDGLFFTAVLSTGIYCRPVCPAPVPRPENVRYYGSAAAAESAGFRPCLRCRPELSPGDGSWRRGDTVLARALKLVESGFLSEHDVGALATRVHLGERQLRRLFHERLGATPLRVHQTRCLLFAKQLLTETALPVTDVALASGFGSLRRFNAAFRDAYRMPPGQLRRQHGRVEGGTLTLRLGYRPPYDFAAMLDFLQARAIPGVEHIEADSYARLIGCAETPGWLRVSAPADTRQALRLEIHGAAPAQLPDIIARLRRMFDLDADPAAIHHTLGADPRLQPLLQQRPGLRQPGGWDGFEVAVRAVLGQQISVAAARTLATRLVERYGPIVDAAPEKGLERLFPTPDTLASADLTSIGLPRTRAATLQGVAQALLDGRVDFRHDRTLDDFVARWQALPGIGPWTAQYIALRALGHPDAFPAEDLVLQKALPTDGTRLSARALLEQAQGWRPWRAYAVMHLWKQAADITRRTRIPPKTPSISSRSAA